MNSYDVIKDYLLNMNSVTAEEVCSRLKLRMGDVRKVFMRLNREGVLSHKKHGWRWVHDYEWTPNYYMVNKEMKNGMDENIIKLHHRAASLAGEASACKNKINYESEERASRDALALNQKVNRPNFHKSEAYSCPFCNGWHIGREMSKEKLRSL